METKRFARVRAIMQQLLRSPLKFPVEAVMGLAFFGIAAWHTWFARWGDTSADILWLFVPLMVLTFWLHKVNRWAYIASGLLFLPLMAFNLKPFLWTYGFAFTYALSAILLILGAKRMDNRTFATHALHVVTQLFFALVITGLLTAAVIAIIASLFYIFGIDEYNLYEYILEFIWFFIAPQVCCTLITQGEDEVREPARVLRLILNFILSPAVIIYTVILYAYFIKIAIEWDLPKGGVAWMVMGFVTAALAGKLMQYVLKQRYYDWFYNHFTWIAIPPLIMYWIGSIYRINRYSFTESRFYLMVAGVLMTLFVLMLLWRRLRNFQLMTLIFGVAIVLFTYIPGISAKSIGLYCQTKRMMQFAKELKLIDAKTGKLVQYINRDGIVNDSLQLERYREACSVIEYVEKATGYDAFEQKYGEWKYNEYMFLYEESCPPDYISLDHSVNLGEYNVMLHDRTYYCFFKQGVVTVTIDQQTVLHYPIDKLLSNSPQMQAHPEQLLIYKNDSLMLVIPEISLKNNHVLDIENNGVMLFRKSN